MATIDRYYFHVCTDGARRKGVDVDRLLRAAGIAPAQLDDPAWRGDVDAMARLVRGIWRALGDEFMGYTAQAMPIGAFAFACELALAGPTIADGLRRAIRFYNLASRDIHTIARDEAGLLAVFVRFAEPQRDPTHYFSEFWLIIWHRLACWLAGETVPMLEARFDYPRPDAYFEEFKYLFPCPRLFDASDRAIAMDGSALKGPVRRSREELAEMLRDAPLAMMSIPASDRTLSRKVRLLLAQDPAMDADRVAQALALHPDTLRRRLRGEGSSLTTIRENVRRDVATRDLAGTGRSVEAIAAALGYAEPRSFTRAFRVWTGMSPSRYRRRHGTGQALA
ncbi:MAG: AraC family transcriptional regulator [Sphingobium sp.]